MAISVFQDALPQVPSGGFEPPNQGPQTARL